MFFFFFRYCSFNYCVFVYYYCLINYLCSKYRFGFIHSLMYSFKIYHCGRKEIRRWATCEGKNRSAKHHFSLMGNSFLNCCCLFLLHHWLLRCMSNTCEVWWLTLMETDRLLLMLAFWSQPCFMMPPLWEHSDAESWQSHTSLCRLIQADSSFMLFIFFIFLQIPVLAGVHCFSVVGICNPTALATQGNFFWFFSFSISKS